MTTPINPYDAPRSLPAPSPTASLPVRVSGVMTADDALSALKAVGKWNPKPMIWLSLAAILLGAGLLVASGGRKGWILPATICVAGVLVLAVWLRAKTRFVANWNARPEHSHPLTWTFSDDGLFVETINSKHLHAWTAFVTVRVTPNMLVLTQQGGQMFNFIPRRFFTSESDWEAVGKFLTQRLPAVYSGISGA